MKMTAEQIQRQQDMADMFNTGSSISAIAKHYGRSVSRIAEIIARARKARLITRREAISVKRDAEIIAMIANGKTQRQVAEHFGLCMANINRIVVSQPGYVPRAQRPKGERKKAFSSADANPSPAPAKRSPAEQIRIAASPATKASDARLIAKYLAMNKPTICPPRALNPTQASLPVIPDLHDPWAGKTSWPASERAMARARARGYRGGAAGHRSNRKGAVI
jgi:transposase